MNTEETTEIEQTEGQDIAKMAEPQIAIVSKLKTKLHEIVEKHKDVTFTDLKDKDGIKAVGLAYTETRNARLDVTKIGKNVVGNLKGVIKMVEEEIDSSIEIISPAEKRLKADKDRIEELKEEQRQEELRKAEEKKQERTNKIYELGLTFNSGTWSIGDIKIDVIQIAQFSDTQFEDFISKATVAYEAEQLRIKQEEEERQRQAELERQAQQQREEEHLAAQAALARQNEALQAERDKEKAERDAILAERREFRVTVLEGKDFVFIPDSWVYSSFEIHDNFLVDATKQQWDAKLADFDVYLKRLEDERNKIVSPPANAKYPVAIEEAVIIPEAKDTVPSANPVEADVFDAIDAQIAASKEEKSDPSTFTALLHFDANNPFLDTMVGKATLRIYPELFLEQASAGLNKDNVSASGAINSELLFYVIKPKQ